MPLRAARRRDRRHRRVWALIDALIWFGAIYGATWLRLDFETRPVLVLSTSLFAVTAAVMQLLVGTLIGPYRVGHQRGSFEETTDLGRAVVVTTVGLFLWALLSHPVVVPRSVPVMAGALALTGMFAGRFLIRSWHNRRNAMRAHERRVI